MELGAQPPGLAGGTAQPPLSALGAAGGPRQRERSLRGTLLLGGGELLAVPVGGELGAGTWRVISFAGGGGLPCAPLSPAGAGGHHT